jgi:replicative DNA helicase
MSEIAPEENSWILTGWEPIDKFIGGIIKAGLITIGASPGVGKTTLVLKLATSMVKKYKKKKVAIFTLEMTTGQITQRALEVAKITKEEKERILLGDSSFSISDIYATAARYAANEDLSMIAVDFADLLIEGEASESVMGNIYKTLSLLAKKTGVPVVLISQLNRNTYTGGTPKVNHLRYSGMSEAMSALILLIYNPHNILVDTNGGKSELETIEGRGYLIEGKSRFGYKKGGPGAVMIEWDGAGGWGDEGLGWYKINS